MNTKLRTLIASSTLGLSVAASPVFAGELEPLRVTVPFAFTAGKASFPAGDYTVYENDAHLLTIRGVKTAMILGTPGADVEDDRNTLSFERTEKGYALKAVRAAGKSAVVPATVHGER